jgi:acetyl-CoA carboxylase biotin carboxyl carrier protein
MPAKKKSPPASSSSEPGELDLIRKLAEILNETGLSEIELDHKGARVRVSRTITIAPIQHTAFVPGPTVATTVSAGAATLSQAAAADVSGTPLKSPMVGTAYLAASPELQPFAALGSQVKQGQTLLIIEAMKTMNQIAAPKSGKLVKILIENGQPVEFGEVLMVIE